MSEMKRKAFKVTRLKISDLHQEAKDELEGVFTMLEASRSDAVTAERSAILATNKAKIKRSEAINQEVEFLTKASSYFKEVGYERIWLVFRDRDGSVVLESPFTEKIQRNMIRAQNQALENQVQNDDSPNDIYEDTEEQDDHQDNGEAA